MTCLIFQHQQKISSTISFMHFSTTAEKSASKKPKTTKTKTKQKSTTLPEKGTKKSRKKLASGFTILGGPEDPILPSQKRAIKKSNKFMENTKPILRDGVYWTLGNSYLTEDEANAAVRKYRDEKVPKKRGRPRKVKSDLADPYVSNENPYLLNDYISLEEKLSSVIVLGTLADPSSTELVLYEPKRPEITKVPESKKKFRISSRKLFLTYPQTGFMPLTTLLEHIQLVLASFGLRSWLIVSEDHKPDLTGVVEQHIHGFFKFEKKVDIKNVELLHLYYESHFYKGSYQSARSEVKCVEYCLKGIFDPTDASKIIASPDIFLRLSKLGALERVEEAMIKLAETGQIDLALTMLRKFFPEKFAVNHMGYEQSFRSLHLKSFGIESRFDYSDFIIPESMQKWLDELDVLRKEGFGKTAYLMGSSGSGKTRFIQAYVINQLKLQPLIITEVNALNKWQDGKHNAIIFDDCHFKRVVREQLIKLLDSEDPSDLRVLYGLANIPPNTPRFLVSNLSMRSAFGALSEDPAILRRVSEYVIGPGIFLFRFNAADSKTL